MAGINNSFRGGRSRESRSPRLEKPSLKYGPSTVAVLKVVRQSEMGAFLDAETGNPVMISCCTKPSRPVKFRLGIW